MLVNIWDSTFAHDVCSTAHQVPAHVQYVRWLKKFGGVTLFTDGYLIDGSADQVDCPVKLGWLHEPPCLIWDVYAQARTNLVRFDSILTYHSELLKLPGFRFMPYGGVWIDKAHWGVPSEKKPYLCSQLAGDKLATDGHRLRHEIARSAGLSREPVYQFGRYGEAVNYSAETKRRVLQPYAFSIVVEACRQDYLFTEILLDCFAVGTIPIFWGCPSIGDYFDTRGILSFETVEQCVEIVRGLSFAQYESLKPYAENNLKLVRDYAVAEDYLYLHHLVPHLRLYDDQRLPA